MEQPSSKRRYTYSPPGRSMSEKELKPEPLLARSKRQFHERSGSIPNEATFDRTILAEDKRPQQYSVCGAPSSDFFHGQGMRRKGKSWKDILKLKRKRAAKLHSPPPTADKTGRESDVYRPRIGGYCIRVVVTEINPQAYYKTLEVTNRTTSFEVILKLIQKYALKDEDRDPNEFYLMEVKEGNQGSYSRVLGSSDQLYELQCRWDEEEDCYFALYRAQLPSKADAEPEVEDKFEQPDINNLRAVIISPSQDSFFDGFPDSRDGLFSSFSPSPLPLPISTQSAATPTSQINTSYRDISSRVQVSRLIVNPSDGSRDSDADTFSDNFVSPPCSLNPVKTVPKYTAFSNPNIETIAESEGEVEAEVFDDEARRLSDSELRQTQRQLMQRSVNMGMRGIMAKVISETKQNTPNRKRAHERSQTAPSQLIALSSSLPPLPLQQDLTIRNLLCSPLAPTQVNRKNIPDFVFTPGLDDGMSDSEVDFQGSESSEPIKSGGSMEKSFGFVGALDFDGCRDEALAEEKKLKEMEKENLKIEEEREWKEKGEMKDKREVPQNKLDVESLNDEQESLNNEQESESLGSLADDVEREEEEEEEEDNGSYDDDDDDYDEDREDDEGKSESEESSKDSENEDSNEGESGDESTHRSSSYEICEDASAPHSASRSHLEPCPASSSVTIHRVLDPSHASIRASATATRHLEMSLVVQIQHSASSEFKQSVEQADDMLKSVLSLPNFHTQANLQNHTTNNNFPSEPISSNESKGSLAENSHLRLRRSQTHQTLYSSVTKVNRPHSIHVTNTPSNSKIDFTKDEIFRKAALHGMMKKPKLKEQPPPANNRSSGDKKFQFPIKDIVTDLDAVSIREKRHRRPFRRHSLLEIKSSNQPYVRLKDRKAVLDGSPPRHAFRQRQKERPKSVNFSEEEQGSPRPNSAPAACKKPCDQSES